MLQVFLDSPDDTLQPPDSNTDGDLLARLDFQFSGVGTNWQTFAYTLNKGSVGLGSKANFTAYYNKLTALRTQWQIENAASAADWGYDADNALVIDNFRVERIYDGLPPLAVSISGTDASLSWGTWSGQGYAQLQKAAFVQGPYSDVPGATNTPAGLPVGAGASFFRLKWVAP